MTQTMMSMTVAPARDGMRNFWVILSSNGTEFPGFSGRPDTKKPRDFPGFLEAANYYPQRGLAGPKAAPRVRGKISTHSHLAPHSVPERKDEVSEDQMPQFYSHWLTRDCLRISATWHHARLMIQC